MTARCEINNKTMRTEIFKDYGAFLSREDKTINGVSQEFADENPNWNQERKNKRCWNCSDCSRCSKYTQAEVIRAIEDDRYTVPCPPALKALPEAPPKPQTRQEPRWQMDLRRKLKLTPSKNDLVAMLLWHAIYSNENSADVAQSIEFSIEELQRALAIIREEMDER